jgi:ATP-dependent protease ClpP protease subunit
MAKVMDSIMLEIPKDVSNLQLPDPELLTYYKNLEDRVLWVDSEINEYSLEYARLIIQWNKEDKKKKPKNRKPIKLLFFSPGGDLDVNNTLIDTIRLSETPVWGINVGRCASAAAFIFLSCHKRFMLPSGYFLFHQGSGAFSGTFQEVYAQMQDYQIAVNRLSEFMLTYTDYTKEEIEENISGEWFVRDAEALQKKVVDKIVDDISILF